MIVCPACQHRNPEGAKACEACGEPLEGFVYRACPACGALNPAENVFCHRCLEKLEVAAPKEPDTEPPVLGEAIEGEAEETQAEEVEDEAETIPPFLAEERPGVEAEEEPSPVEDVSPSPQAFPEAPRTERPGAGEATLPPFIEVEQTEEAPTPEVAEEGKPPVAEAPSPDEVESEAVQAEVRAATPPEQPSEEAAEEELPVEGETLPQIAQDPLQGIEDSLPLEVPVSLPHRAEPLPSEGPTQEERADAELLRRIAEEGAPLQERERGVEENGIQRLSGLGRALLYLLVLLAALTPLFTGGQMALWVFPRQSVGSLVDTMSTLAVHTPVLISFDYSPAYAGELDPLARVVVGQLAARSVPMVVMSTKPEGIGSAARIYDTVAQETANYRYGEDYAILGYLSGQEAGLRTLKKGLSNAFKEDYVRHRALSEIPVTSGLASVQDFEHVIILSDEGTIVRRWIEQVRRGNIILLHALVSARVEPILMPYERAGQLETLIGGAYGAAEYESASQMGGAAARSVDADAVLFLVMLLIAVITNVVYASRGDARSSRS